VETGAAVRIVALESSRQLANLRHPEIESKYARQMQTYREAADEELFEAVSVEVHLRENDAPGHPRSRVICGKCGEEMNDGREVNGQDGSTLCRPCAFGTFSRDHQGSVNVGLNDFYTDDLQQHEPEQELYPSLSTLMYEMIIVGAGPAGVSMAVEARAVGISSTQILVLEKGDTHSWAIRKFYPAAKVVLANYKGIEAVCAGVMCISDMSKEETLTYIDRAIADHGCRSDAKHLWSKPGGLRKPTHRDGNRNPIMRKNFAGHTQE
jgi:hypothetical protein